MHQSGHLIGYARTSTVPETRASRSLCRSAGLARRPSCAPPHHHPKWEDMRKRYRLVGSLRLLGKHMTELFNETQQSGRPREIAEERWVTEVADIYENAFGRPASILDLGHDTNKCRGQFYRLLELSRPTEFPLHGKLSIRQVGRILKRQRHTSGATDNCTSGTLISRRCSPRRPADGRVVLSEQGS
jgi:hypothetical protein